MTTHTFRLVYDGLGATRHKMPPSLVKQITAGAQEFLGSHAYFFTEGQIPTNVQDHSKQFQIHDWRQRDGSWEGIFVIDIGSAASEFFAQYVKELSKHLAGRAATATPQAFSYLIRRSYQSWKERRHLSETTFDRIEPVLTEATGNRAPIVDVESEGVAQRKRLYDRTYSSMMKVSAPIGRAALHVDIYFDDVLLDRIEHRFYTDEEIATALLPLREHADRHRHN